MIENLPFSALRVFECAARHLSFKLAAKELFVTPAAVSQQIKTLEDLLGVKLFERHNRGLTLTDEAKAGLPALTAGFEHIVESVHMIRNASVNQSLTVWMAPAFAAKWLIPRLPEFSRIYPYTDLNISASLDLIDTNTSYNTIPAENFRRDNVDIAIRYGKGDYPGCRVDHLFDVSAVPLCSPSLLKGRNPLRKPQDLHHHKLLHDNTRFEGRPDWSTWLAAAGVDDVNPNHGIRFSSVDLALSAAAEGQGVVLSLEALAADDIADGRLVIPFDISLPVNHAYYIITLEEYADDPLITLFREWLMAEAKKDKTTIRKKGKSL